jgi:hypothetical protein
MVLVRLLFNVLVTVGPYKRAIKNAPLCKAKRGARKLVVLVLVAVT